MNALPSRIDGLNGQFLRTLQVLSAALMAGVVLFANVVAAVGPILPPKPSATPAPAMSPPAAQPATPAGGNAPTPVTPVAAVTADATIRGEALGSEIVITTTDRCAEAIHFLRWNGREFIDSADHGRQVQSASNLDCATPITGETYNPTEAGSRRDGAGPNSSSKILSLKAAKNVLETSSRMAFSLVPGESRRK